jgi:fructose-bisphosphate aldolase class I
VHHAGLGKYISGAILFDETLYQKTAGGRQFVDVLLEQGIYPGIKVDTGLQVGGGGREGRRRSQLEMRPCQT